MLGVEVDQLVDPFPLGAGLDVVHLSHKLHLGRTVDRLRLLHLVFVMLVPVVTNIDVSCQVEVVQF